MNCAKCGKRIDHRFGIDLCSRCLSAAQYLAENTKPSFAVPVVKAREVAIPEKVGLYVAESSDLGWTRWPTSVRFEQEDGRVLVLHVEKMLRGADTEDEAGETYGAVYSQGATRLTVYND